MSEPPMNPAAARRWLAVELRRLRVEADMSMQQVAEKVTMSKGRLSFLETSARRVRPDDLDDLLPLYNVVDDARARYYRAARAARAKGWWEHTDSSSVPEQFSIYVELEQAATAISIFEPLLINGLFQTSDYAAAMTRGGIYPRTEEQVERVVRFRTERQKALVRDADPLRCWLVLSEAGLRHVIGDHAVMAAQLAHLADLATRPNITVQVVPFSQGIHIVPGRFSVLDFGEPNDPGLVYIEYSQGAHYPVDQAAIDGHKLTFQHLCSRALSPQESRDLILRIAQEFIHD